MYTSDLKFKLQPHSASVPKLEISAVESSGFDAANCY